MLTRAGIVQNMDWTGLNSWTGLDWSVGMDWTVGLDWTDFNIYFKMFCISIFSFSEILRTNKIGKTGNIVWLAICFKMGSLCMGSNPMYILVYIPYDKVCFVNLVQ